MAVDQRDYDQGAPGPGPRIVTVREYADHRGVTRQAIEGAIASGRLDASVVARVPMLRLDLDVADREWETRTHPLRGGVRPGSFEPRSAAARKARAEAQAAAQAAQDPPAAKPARSLGRAAGRAMDATYPRHRTRRRDDRRDDPDDEHDDDDGDDTAPNLTTERALKARVDRKLAEINLERAQGQVVPVDAAKRLWFTRWRTLRDRMLAMASREASVLAGTTDADQIEAMLGVAIRQAFDELGDTPPTVDA